MSDERKAVKGACITHVFSSPEFLTFQRTFCVNKMIVEKDVMTFLLSIYRFFRNLKNKILILINISYSIIIKKYKQTNKIKRFWKLFTKISKTLENSKWPLNLFTYM